MDDDRQQQNPMAAQKQLLPQQPQEQRLTLEQSQYALMVLKKKQAQKAAQDKLDFEDRQSRIKDMLAPENRATPVVISSRSEYLAMDAAYKSLSTPAEEDPDVNMDGYPTTNADWVARTAQLTTAINNLNNTLDKPAKNQTDDEANTAVKAVNSLSTLEVQLLAGKILIATCDAHSGHYNFPSWPKVWQSDRYESFDDRFKDVCRALTRSKALVKSVMDSEFPFPMRLAVAPDSEFKMKLANQKMNDKRAAKNKDMKKRLREDNAKNDEDGGAAPE